MPALRLCTYCRHPTGDDGNKCPCFYLIIKIFFGWCPGFNSIAISEYRSLGSSPSAAAPMTRPREVEASQLVIDMYGVILAAANVAGDPTSGLQGGYGFHVARQRV